MNGVKKKPNSSFYLAAEQGQHRLGRAKPARIIIRADNDSVPYSFAVIFVFQLDIPALLVRNNLLPTLYHAKDNNDRDIDVVLAVDF
jgi:hypothetical protein